MKSLYNWLSDIKSLLSCATRPWNEQEKWKMSHGNSTENEVPTLACIWDTLYIISAIFWQVKSNRENYFSIFVDTNYVTIILHSYIEQ